MRFRGTVRAPGIARRRRGNASVDRNARVDHASLGDETQRVLDERPLTVVLDICRSPIAHRFDDDGASADVKKQTAIAPRARRT